MAEVAASNDAMRALIASANAVSEKVIEPIALNEVFASEAATLIVANNADAVTQVAESTIAMGILDTYALTLRIMLLELTGQDYTQFANIQDVINDETAFNAILNSEPNLAIAIGSSVIIPLILNINPFFDVSNSPGPIFPINDLDGNPMQSVEKGIAYYGTVSANELFTATELSTACGISQGTVVDDEREWHKYYWNGGVHFYRTHARKDIHGNHIWSARSYFGTGTPTSRRGYTPTRWEGNVSQDAPFIGIDQDREITKNGITYIPRLLEGIATDPGDTFDYPGSEVNLILMNLHVATNPGFYDGATNFGTSTTDGITYNDWIADRIDNDDFVGWKTNLGDNEIIAANSGQFMAWMQETISAQIQNRVRRFGNGSTSNIRTMTQGNNGTPNQQTGSFGWTYTWMPVITVKHPLFATYGKSAGFNQNEPDW